MASAAFAAAQGPETQDVQVTFTDDGEFTVSLGAPEGEEAPSFGVVPLDALDDISRTMQLELTYTDTHTDRSGGEVSLSATSFLPDPPVPPFAGSDEVDFQIPDRYLVLTSIGQVEAEADVECEHPGSITVPTNAAEIEGLSFDGDVPLTVATVTEGCGVGTATQTIELTLTVPAGVYPTEYTAILTVETTVDETP